VRGRDLPRPLLLTGGGREVRVDAARGGANHPAPAVREALGSGALIRFETAAAGMDVDVNDQDSGLAPGGKADVRVGLPLPPVVDHLGRRGRVVEAVRCHWLLAARDAGEDRDPEVRIANRGTTECRLAPDAAHSRDGPVGYGACGVVHADEIASAGSPGSGELEEGT
jgi:hypothetical protein